MAYRFLTWVPVVSSLSVLSLSAGCYSRRTADEELLDFPARVLAGADAASSSTGSGDSGRSDAAVGDAGTARCTGTDPIALFLCNLTTPAAGGSNTNALGDLTKLLDSAGGLAGIASILGAFTGTGGTGRPTTTTPGTTTQPSLVDLINLAGGLSNIATLLNGLLGGTTMQPGASNPIADLIAAFAQTATAPNASPSMNRAPPTLVDWLDGLGLAQPQARTKSLSTPAPTTAECAAALDPSTQFFCTLQAAQASTSLAE